tara:strand:- start:275 stop:517 length:243 start_codon:yes stop_codon:yes gene_type:complete
MGEAKLNVKYGHTRAIDSEDKFFIVYVRLKGDINIRIGWFEKEFIEEDFVRIALQGRNLEILNIIEFTDYDEYQEYKDNN